MDDLLDIRHLHTSFFTPVGEVRAVRDVSFSLRRGEVLGIVGESGSVRVVLIPAPRGLGIAAGDTSKKVMDMASIKDVWTRTAGSTRTTLNFAKATYNALINTIQVRA